MRLLRRSAVVALALASLGWLWPAGGAAAVPGGPPFGHAFWPGAGLALGWLYLWRAPVLPAVAIGWFGCWTWAGLPPASAAALAITGSAGPWLASRWLHRQGFDPQLAKRRDPLLLLAAGALGGAAVSGVGGAAWLVASGHWPLLALPGRALQWWGLHALGVVVFAVPLLLLGRAGAARSPSRWPATQLGLAAASLACGALALALPAEASVAATALLFMLPPVLLCALCQRAGLAPASACAALLVALLLAGQASGGGPWAGQPWVAGALPPGPAVLAALLTGLLWVVHGHGLKLHRSVSGSQRALDLAGVGLAQWPAPGGKVQLSAQWCALTLDPDGQHSQRWGDWLDRLHPNDRTTLELALADAGAAQRPWQHQTELRLRAGTGWRWFSLQLEVPGFDGQGQPLAVQATLADRQALYQARAHSRLATQVLQQLHEGLLVTDEALRVVDANPAYSQITGLARDALIGQVPALLQPDADDVTGRERQANLWAALHQHDQWAGQLRTRHADGHDLHLMVTVSSTAAEQGEPAHCIVLVNNITEQQRQQEQLLRQAHFDELTRLPNRARLGELMREAMSATDRDGYLLVVCYLDLDHFKAVNARHGRQAGDGLLAELANRLRSALRSRGAGWSDSAARLGGDEFVLLLRAGTLDEARAAVERVLRVLSLPLLLAPEQAAEQVTASVGATVYPLDASNADTLLRHANQAMYSVKQSGRNGYLFFDLEHSRRNEQRVLAIGRVQDALDQGELQLYYQPKVDLQRGKVLGVEALLRWVHPERGVLPPAQFLPLIERTGLSARVGDHVLAQALDQLQVWQAQGLDLAVSVNISGRHLQEPDFALRLAELLARHPQPLGPRLELEVLETVALTDIAYTSALMARCAELGVRWALDDFGTGYSTLTYLKRLPVQVLKIDRSFVQHMLDDSQDRAIVEGVIGLASTFACVAVAEGVESAAQARMLLDMGCQVGQGLGIAAPMPAAEVGPWVREWRGLFALSAAATPADAAAPATGVATGGPAASANSPAAGVTSGAAGGGQAPLR